MKKVTIFCVLLSYSLSVVGCHSLGSQKTKHEVQQTAAQSEQRSREWRAATYRGLAIGKSTRDDMLHVFGQPQWSRPPGDQIKGDPNPEVWNEYESRGEFPGKLLVVLDEHSGVILAIDLYPENLTKEDAIKYFGDDYITTRYDFDMCLGNDESGPVYESPNGSILYIEYRERGIALGIDYQGKVDQIQYVSKPIGAPSSKCKQASEASKLDFIHYRSLKRKREAA